MTWFYRHPHGDAYYNEFDEGAAAWLRELMRANLIAPGVIDIRSILAVQPLDLIGFTQCHFFAGIGGWSYALRLAGWPDDRPVWTGSPPCQPFSVAGQDKGKDDDRHLAPHFINLVRAARPAVLFGEQVASAAVFGRVAGKAKRGPAKPPEWAWLDDLSDRLEAAHYAVGASDIPAAGVGAPHIRQRTFFGAYDLRSAASGLEHASSTRGPAWIPEPTQREERQPGEPHNAMRGLSGPNSGRPSSDRLAQPDSRERSGIAEHGEHVTDRAQGGRVQRDSEPARDSCAGGLEHGAGDGRIKRRTQPEGRGVVGGCSPERLADAAGARPLPGAQPGVYCSEESAGPRDGELERSCAAFGVAGPWKSYADWFGVCWNNCEGGCLCGDREDGPNGYFWDRHEGWIDIVAFIDLLRSSGDSPTSVDPVRPNPLDGFWANADWLFCRDGKWRPVEPGLEPLAHGVPGRVGLLRGYGNAICPWAAKEFIEIFIETRTTVGSLRMTGAPQTVIDEVFG